MEIKASANCSSIYRKDKARWGSWAPRLRPPPSVLLLLSAETCCQVESRVLSACPPTQDTSHADSDPPLTNPRTQKRVAHIAPTLTHTHTPRRACKHASGTSQKVCIDVWETRLSLCRQLPRGNKKVYIKEIKDQRALFLKRNNKIKTERGLYSFCLGTDFFLWGG